MNTRYVFFPFQIQGVTMESVYREVSGSRPWLAMKFFLTLNVLNFYFSTLNNPSCHLGAMSEI